MPLTKAPKRRLRKGLTAKEAITSTRATSSHQPQKVPLELQQRVLDIFKNACSLSLGDSLAGTIQEIKQHLFNRDFGSAFGNSAYLEAYAARWSPTRALTYLDILCSLPAIYNQLLQATTAEQEQSYLSKSASNLSIGSERTAFPEATSPYKRVISIGCGGGAELVALAGTLHQLHTRDTVNQLASRSQQSSCASLDCVFMDIADWSLVLQKLQANVTETASLNTKNLPIASKSTSTPLVAASDFNMRFMQQDILEAWEEDLSATLTGACLVTIMFTLNELYTSSMASTTRMLLLLTSLLEPGALLLVVDSPGSFSTVSLEKATDTDNDPTARAKSSQTPRKYPMQWLLDHTLLETATVIDSHNKSCKQWKKLDSRESQWFRLSPQLRYPLDLEDMRYQMHVYQKLQVTDTD